jgi:hypothetical protein
MLAVIVLYDLFQVVWSHHGSLHQLINNTSEQSSFIHCMQQMQVIVFVCEHEVQCKPEGFYC